MVNIFGKLWFLEGKKRGELVIFPQTAPLIVPDQKVTVDALNAVFRVVVKCFRVLLGTEGGCVPAGAPTLK